MQIQSMSQSMVKEISPHNFAEGSEPLPRSCDSYSIRGYSTRGRLFFKSLPRAIGTVTMRSMKQTLILIVVATTIFAARPLETFADQLTQETTEAARSASETPADLQQLVAPIALYPDALVAQILAASTYPTQIVQADRWLQGRVNLPPEQIAAEVDKESWDPSVKALTAFPSVLANLDQNLSWTTALGEAYFSQPQDVLDSVQVMRRRAEDAGSLRSTPQQTVITQGPRIVIETVQPDVCYLPVYDPWLVYGPPIVAYPGYFYGAWLGTPFVSFGPAITLGFFSGYGWGWPAWGFNWGSRIVVFNHNAYVPHSPLFFRRGPFPGSQAVLPGRPGVFPGRVNRGFARNHGVPNTGVHVSGWANRDRVGVGPRASMGSRLGAFTGFRSGRVNRGSVAGGRFGAGRASFGGGGRSSGGGGRAAGRGGRHR